MKLQFAFGNPRRGRKARKSVAKRRKKPKTKSVKAKLKKAVAMAKRKKRRTKRVTKRKSRRAKRNPVYMMAYKKGADGKKRLVASHRFPTEKEIKAKLDKEPSVKKMKAQILSAPLESRGKMRLAYLEAMKRSAGKYITDIEQKKKFMLRLNEEGAEIKTSIKEGEVARKKKKPKKASKKKATKKASSKKSTNKKSTKKSSKKKSIKKSAKKSTKKKTGRRKKRRYPKMIAHKHSKSTRHIAKGSTAKVSSRKRKGRYKISTAFGKGKKKVRVSGSVRVGKKGLLGRLKINPFGRNPMKNLSATSKAYLGLDVADLGSLAIGGALVPVANGLVGRYAPNIASMVSQYVGPQAAGSVIPVLLGVALNAVAEHGVKSGQGHDLLKKAGNGLAAAGVIGLAMSLSQRYAAPMIGMAGINYTPSMRGINYTPSMGIMPQMNGINYTPGMGIMPQLNGMGSVDFGSANYGGGGGSREARTQRSDFGADWSQDSEAEGLNDEDNSYSSSMN